MRRSRCSVVSPSRSLPLILAAILALHGCASSSNQPVTMPPVTVTDSGPSPEGQRPAAAPGGVAGGREGAARNNGETKVDAEENAEEEAGAEDPTLLVLGERSRGAPSTTREMLQRAARDARDERERIGEPVMVINDENLAEHAQGGRVSLGLADPPSLEDADSAPDELAEKERFWRTKVLEIRQRWREAYDSIEPLEAEAARLRTRFYSEDDPVRRDREIKPQWDRTLDRLTEAERTMTTAGEELAIAFEQGRRDGALPGWLREGNELGPFDFEEPAEGEPLDELRASEPTVVEAQSLEPPF